MSGQHSSTVPQATGVAPHSGGSGGAPAGGPGGPVFLLSGSGPGAKAAAQVANQMTVVYFTVAISALCAIIIASHLIFVASSKTSVRNKVPKSALVGVRFIRGILLREAPFFGSLGHVLVFCAYIIINLILILQNNDLTQLKPWAKRIGWIATCNIALITFLALKNTPLAFLTPYSYERLNILHQAAGHCTVFFGVLHGILQVVGDSQKGYLHGLRDTDNVMGIVAVFGMMTMFTTALTLRGMRYEVFYVVHITVFMLILIAVGLHQPSWATKSIYITIFAGAIWTADRTLRGIRMLYYSFANRATIYPLSQGGVRVVMKRTPWRAASGTHAFLWIPGVRAFETHPFTIVSTSPLELVVSPQDGFTQDLSALAAKNPGAVLRASADGPYGTLPNFRRFDHVVLIAGGSGATFTFGVALNLVRNPSSNGARPMIHFIWIVRDHEMRDWFPNELIELSASDLVDLTIHVTRTIMAADSSHNNDLTISKQEETDHIFNHASSFEKSQAIDSGKPQSSDPDTSPRPIDSEKAAASGSHSPTSSSSEPSQNHAVVLGRPDIGAAVRTIVNGSAEDERTIVAACGPDGMMSDVRAVVGELVVGSGRSVTLHYEKFGW